MKKKVFRERQTELEKAMEEIWKKKYEEFVEETKKPIIEESKPRRRGRRRSVK